MPAKSPYNFVPINRTVITTDGPGIDMDCYNSKRYSGYIDLDIETLTPLYIRDTYNKDEELRARQSEEDSKWQNPDFFSPGHVPAIPGSSLRGMLRSLIEIISWSKMAHIEDRKLYFRKVGQKGRYQRMMLDINGSVPYAIPGWLRKVGQQYVIFPLESKDIYRINFSPVLDERIDKWLVNGQQFDPFKFHKVSFKPTKIIDHEHPRVFIDKRTREQKKVILLLKYALVSQAFMHNDQSIDSNIPGYESGYVVLSGLMGHNTEKHCKHMHWIIHRPKQEPAPSEIKILSDEVINNYESDTNRDKRADLFKQLKEYPDGVPCFYITQNNKILAFGHTPLFRLPYAKSIRDHLPSAHRKNLNRPDFAETIFGNADKFAGRVFFEDAKIVPNQDNIYLDIKSPKILATPKPTCALHYLEQNTGAFGANDWDSSIDETNRNALIRGHKMYWHRKTPLNSSMDYSWAEANVLEDSPQHTSIRAINREKKFKGPIRFENLSHEELGALLMSLELPENCHHKIGMGKPLGLGSIKIKPSLFICDRNERYGKLFTDNGNEWRAALKEDTSLEKYKEAFAGFIITALDGDEKSPDLNEQQSISSDQQNSTQFWNLKRMQELKAILNWSLTDKHEVNALNNWLEKTRYMRIPSRRGERNEFNDRNRLPWPSEILNT